jgi:hypothetical protein
MKHTFKRMPGILSIMSIMAFSMFGCVEGHYYHRYHHHTRGWYDHRHMAYPAGVDFNVDVR